VSISSEQYKRIIYWFNKGNELSISEGAKSYNDLSALRTAFFIYKENYRVLRKAIQNYYKQPEILKEDSVRRWRRQRILIKDFQNSLTSAWSFVERYKNPKYYLKDTFHCFFKELRNFTVHKQILPLLSVSLHKEDFTEIRYETFKRENFQKYLENSLKEHPNRIGYEKALSYLLSLQKDKSLNEILADYDSKISKYYIDEVRNIVNTNYENLMKFSTETGEVHKHFPNHPITASKLRHLNYLLLKASKNQ